MRNIRIFLIILTGCLLNCSVAPTKPANPRELQLEDVESLKIGGTTSDSILRKFGLPQVQLSNDKEKNVSWLYFSQKDPKADRANFVFDTKSRILKEMNWLVHESENESKPSKIFPRYTGSKFKRHTIQWQVADYFTSRTTYVDNKRGIEIVTRDDRPEIAELITFALPGSIKERDGFIGILKYEPDDWKVIVDRRETYRSSASLE